jgi:hypothetical protein
MYKQRASFGITFGTHILLNPSTQNCQQISQTKRTQKHRSVTPQNRDHDVVFQDIEFGLGKVLLD